MWRHLDRNIHRINLKKFYSIDKRFKSIDNSRKIVTDDTEDGAEQKQKFDYANWPNKDKWNHYKVLDAIMSVTNTQPNKAWNDELHFDPMLAPNEKSHIAAVLAAKRYGVQAAIDIIEKYPDLTLFRDPYKKKSIPEENFTLKDVIRCRDAYSIYESYKKMIIDGVVITDDMIFTMIEKACLYNDTGLELLDDQLNNENNNVKCYADVIFDDLKCKITNPMMEGYFFGHYYRDEREKCHNFFIENLTYDNKLFSSHYYYYVLREIPIWYTSLEARSFHTNKILRCYQHHNKIPSPMVMNEIFYILKFDDKQFLDLLDEINHLNYSLTFKSFCIVDEYFGEKDNELAIHYMKRFVREYMPSDMFTLNDINEYQTGGFNYLSHISDQFSTQNMWNYYMMFVKNLSRINAWDVLNGVLVTKIIDNLLRIETSMSNYKLALDFLSITNIPLDITTNSLDTYIRGCSRYDLNTFISLNEPLKKIYQSFFKLSNLTLQLEIITSIILRDHQTIGAESAKECIKYLNSIMIDKRTPTMIKNKSNDAYLILHLIAHNYDTAIWNMKKGVPKTSNARAVNTAVHNVLKTYDDYLLVQEILLNFQRYFAMYNIEQSRIMMGRHRGTSKKLPSHGVTKIDSNNASNN